MTLIDVTQKDIDEGQSTCEQCPIALAAQRAFGYASHTMIDGWTIYADGLTYSLPEEAKRFIDAFDSGQPVKPFTFEVGEPWER